MPKPLQLDSFLQNLRARNPHEPEFLQAVEEVAESLIPYINQHPKYLEYRVLERMCEPDRSILFRVTWEDDAGDIHVNRGYRVQFNNSIGPYKGGLRFHPTVNLSVLKFLGFEQTFKNSLTDLPIGAGKGGSDFNPKGKSDREVMRFCQAFMNELYHYIGENIDVPAGDIGVGGREIAFLFGQYKRLTHEFAGVLTGKALEYGGSLVRLEATGYGVVYFLKNMLQFHGREIKGKRCVISGSGNVAIYAAEKALQLGMRVLTLSDSGGFVLFKNGLSHELLEAIKQLKTVRRGRISELAEQFNNVEFFPGQKPWGVPCDVALPCATQNELDADDAKKLIANGCEAVCEGANMPCTKEAVHAFLEAGVLYAPGKASNAGGVAVSGLEMSQNSLRMSWSREELDEMLREIMRKIHDKCVRYGKEGQRVNYLKGANIAGFVKVADAMVAFGVM
jgi:glutamate dehydrogenase (NADP+)